MESIFNNLSPFIIPPLLSLIMGLTLAIVSLFRGKLRTENVLFALVCIWWVILTPAFISHFIFRGNLELIMNIERTIHFLYVWTPVINLVYFHRILKIKRNYLIYFGAALSIFISVFIPTDYYFTGLYTFSWGYIAKGGPVLQLVGLYGMSFIIYFIIVFIMRIRKEENQVVRLKIKYILFSIILVACMSILNIPAMKGIDFYPFGNMVFIPLSFLAYGVLRYRLMDIRSILHVTLIWGVTSSLIIIPNVFLILYVVLPVLKGAGAAVSILVLIAWFGVNYLYFRKVQPFIDQLFNRRKFDLRNIEQDFIEKVSHLSSLDELVVEFTGIIARTFSFGSAELFIRDDDSEEYLSPGGASLGLNHELIGWFVKRNHILEKNMVETNPRYETKRDELLKIFEKFNSNYLVPLIAGDSLLALLVLSERLNLRQLARNDIQFINNLRSAASISLSNSIMYQDISDLKDNLEVKVEERTAELKQARDALWGEMELAKKIQTVLLPERPSIDGYEISGYMKPADEVGGDYYDVINVDDLDWIVIGDVSGHGVPAGLIMMMVQTSIRTALMGTSNMKPAVLLDRVNSVIIDNIRKLEEDKYMTITVMACVRNGKFYFSGLHLDIMIYRAETDTVELVETQGMWIGVVDNLKEVLVDDSLNLNVNDVLFVYTDGITEAWEKGSVKNQRNVFDDMYGEERLVDIFKSLGREPVDKIKEGVINSLDNYECRDDVTLLMLKRLE